MSKITEQTETTFGHVNQLVSSVGASNRRIVSYRLEGERTLGRYPIVTRGSDHRKTVAPVPHPRYTSQLKTRSVLQRVDLDLVTVPERDPNTLSRKYSSVGPISYIPHALESGSVLRVLTEQ